MRIAIAEIALTCSCCGGTIPEGHRYWIRESHYDNNDGPPVEHTNCELYAPRTRGDQRRVR